MTDPDFLVVGTARAGTTALHQYLRQHPGIFLPSLKEPCYYCFAGEKQNYKKGRFTFAVRNGAEYNSLFKSAPVDSCKGEISTPYLFLYEKTIENIYKLHNDPARLKIIIILRNPAERAYSQYLWKVRDGREELSFDDALRHERSRMLQNYSFDYFYAHRGLYFKQVSAYMEAFSNVKIFLYDHFRQDPNKTLNELCKFLGVDEFNFERRDDINASHAPRFAAVGRLITMESGVKFRMLNMLPDTMRDSIKQQFMRWNKSSGKLPPMSSFAKQFLHEFYMQDLHDLQKITGFNLSSWING